MSELLHDDGHAATHAPAAALPPEGNKRLGGLVGAGLRWSLATQIGLRAATFLSGVVLARILVPEEFGVYAVALAAMNLLLSISDAGLILAVIQWQGDLEEVKSTAFTLTLAMSVGLYLLCFALAGPFAELMGSPQAIGVLRLMTLAVIIDGFTAVPAATLHRAFRQDRMAVAELAAIPVNIGVSVLLALLGAGAWSLAWGRLAGGLVSGSLVLLLASFRPRFGFDPDLARTLLRFGLPLATTLLIEAALLNLDYVVVGHLLGPVALGFYLLAFNVSSWPISVLRAAVRRVSIAGFSRLQDDEAALAAGFARSFGLLMTVTVPVCLLLALLAPPLIEFVYGERWSAAAGVLRFLAILGGVRVATSLVFDVLVAAGRPRAPLWLQLTWLAVLAPALIAGTRLDGIRGTAIAHAFVGGALVLPLFLLALRPLGVTPTSIARELARPAVAAALASVVCLKRARRAIKSPLRAAWRRLLLRRGRDVTCETVARSCLVLAAHPDDETLGCGATILRKRIAGTKVWVVVATDGGASHHSRFISSEELTRMRAREASTACGLLGVPEEDLIHLGYPDTRLGDHLSELVARLRELVAELQPDEILVTSHLDHNGDHQALARAVRLARETAPAGCRVAEYPVWYWVDGPWLRRGGNRPLTARVVDFWRDPVKSLARLRPELVAIDGLADRKRDAILSYRSQTTNLTGEPGWKTFDPTFIPAFLQTHEVFFPLTTTPTPIPTPTPMIPASGAGPAGGLSDPFLDDRPPGQVIGSATASGLPRRGVDVERRIGIDHGAVRIAPLVEPGWGRAGIAYGPFERRPGLAMAAFVLNGHNASQSDPRREGRKARLRRWARELPRSRLRRPEHRDNLAVGWFPEMAPVDPTTAGNGIVMRTASTENGELRARTAGRQLRVHRGVQNVPIQYVVGLRDAGAIYYATSVAGASGLAGHPYMRPIGIDHVAAEPTLYAGVHQRILGEVGYRADTRIAEVRVAVASELERWCTTAQAADRLRGTGPLAGSVAETGGSWEATRTPLRSPGGLVGGERGGMALLRPGAPSGLVHALVETGNETARAGLVWRADRAGACWRVEVGHTMAELAVCEDGRWSAVASSHDWRLRPNALHALQILDDGVTFGLHLDGELLFGRWFTDPRQADADGVGITIAEGTTVRVRDFEAHPRSVPIPLALDLGPPWARQGTLPRIVDEFPGPPTDLDGAAALGDRQWRRVLGKGVLERTGQGGVRVRADRQHPNPGRTAYAVDWLDHTFADVEVEITPPGTERGQGENGRGGIVLWQDVHNYLIVNTWLDDLPRHDGSSVSAFLMAHGNEDMYDAVWSNVGRTVTWGERYRLRVSCDGERFLVWLNDEPVLYRAFADIRPDAPRLALRAVGLAVNWEWGDDTGSVFHRFVARDGGTSHDPGGSRLQLRSTRPLSPTTASAPDG